MTASQSRPREGDGDVAFKKGASAVMHDDGSASSCRSRFVSVAGSQTDSTEASEAFSDDDFYSLASGRRQRSSATPARKGADDAAPTKRPACTPSVADEFMSVAPTPSEYWEPDDNDHYTLPGRPHLAWPRDQRLERARAADRRDLRAEYMHPAHVERVQSWIDGACDAPPGFDDYDEDYDDFYTVLDGAPPRRGGRGARGRGYHGGDDDPRRAAIWQAAAVRRPSRGRGRPYRAAANADGGGRGRGRAYFAAPALGHLNAHAPPWEPVPQEYAGMEDSAAWNRYAALQPRPLCKLPIVAPSSDSLLSDLPPHLDGLCGGAPAMGDAGGAHQLRRTPFAIAFPAGRKPFPPFRGTLRAAPGPAELEGADMTMPAVTLQMLEQLQSRSDSKASAGQPSDPTTSLPASAPPSEPGAPGVKPPPAGAPDRPKFPQPLLAPALAGFSLYSTQIPVPESLQDTQGSTGCEASPKRAAGPRPPPRFPQPPPPPPPSLAAPQQPTSNETLPPNPLVGQIPHHSTSPAAQQPPLQHAAGRTHSGGAAFAQPGRFGGLADLPEDPFKDVARPAAPPPDADDAGWEPVKPSRRGRKATSDVVQASATRPPAPDAGHPSQVAQPSERGRTFPERAPFRKLDIKLVPPPAVPPGFDAPPPPPPRPSLYDTYTMQHKPRPRPPAAQPGPSAGGQAFGHRPLGRVAKREDRHALAALDLDSFPTLGRNGVANKVHNAAALDFYRQVTGRAPLPTGEAEREWLDIETQQRQKRESLRSHSQPPVSHARLPDSPPAADGFATPWVPPEPIPQALQAPPPPPKLPPPPVATRPPTVDAATEPPKATCPSDADARPLEARSRRRRRSRSRRTSRARSTSSSSSSSSEGGNGRATLAVLEEEKRQLRHERERLRLQREREAVLHERQAIEVERAALERERAARDAERAAQAALPAAGVDAAPPAPPAAAEPLRRVRAFDNSLYPPDEAAAPPPPPAPPRVDADYYHYIPVHALFNTQPIAAPGFAPLQYSMLPAVPVAPPRMPDYSQGSPDLEKLAETIPDGYAPPRRRVTQHCRPPFHSSMPAIEEELAPPQFRRSANAHDASGYYSDFADVHASRQQRPRADREEQSQDAYNSDGDVDGVRPRGGAEWGREPRGGTTARTDAAKYLFGDLEDERRRRAEADRQKAAASAAADREAARWLSLSTKTKRTIAGDTLSWAARTDADEALDSNAAAKGTDDERGGKLRAGQWPSLAEGRAGGDDGRPEWRARSSAARQVTLGSICNSRVVQGGSQPAPETAARADSENVDPADAIDLRPCGMKGPGLPRVKSEERLNGALSPSLDGDGPAPRDAPASNAPWLTRNAGRRA